MLRSTVDCFNTGAVTGIPRSLADGSLASDCKPQRASERKGTSIEGISDRTLRLPGAIGRCLQIAARPPGLQKFQEPDLADAKTKYAPSRCNSVLPGLDCQLGRICRERFKLLWNDGPDRANVLMPRFKLSCCTHPTPAQQLERGVARIVSLGPSFLRET